jgi:hypothetical protein
MPRFAIVKAVRRREPAIDFVSAREAGLHGVSDPELLIRVAKENRVLVSHDRRTMLDISATTLPLEGPAPDW